MTLVRLPRSRMQELRSDGCVAFLERVTLFCNRYGVEFHEMDGVYVPYGRSQRFARNQTNDDHFRREVYIGIIDQISQEFDNHFDEVNMKLLSCMAALNPTNSFASFGTQKVEMVSALKIKIANLGGHEFKDCILMPLQSASICIETSYKMPLSS
uniref:Uncharacterized protein n=1 Tax=Oryza glaberrima TaxID=4538 RepID=I1QZV5_ORYGL